MNNIEMEEKHGAHYYKPLPVTLVKGQGVWLWDDKGTKYLDMMGAYSAASHGHGHPRLIKALKDQADRLCVPSRQFYTDKLGPLLTKLSEITGLDKGAPMNSGAEAVEVAVKAARRWGYRKKKIEKDKAEIIVAAGNFHGRTTTIISFSSDAEYQADFGPLTPGFKIVPYTDLKAYEAAITKNTCAILIEPLQGEGGIIVPPDGFLRDLRALCDKHNVLLILDEIQSGFGRTGKMFAFEHEGIKPDGIILGKALGGGMLPVSCFMGTNEIMDLFAPGSHGSTYGGNPLSCAVALEAINVLQEEKLVERSAELGKYMLEKLRAVKSPLIRDVRGRGLWAGVDFDPKKTLARPICERMMKRGVLSKETHETVVRFSPAFVITKEEIDFAVAQLQDSLRETEAALAA